MIRPNLLFSRIDHNNHGMFDLAQLECAIDMQQRSYRLLKWLAGAVSIGLIRFSTAHSFASLSQGASSWLLEHLQNIPPDARPERQDIAVFANFFSTYLENSFDFDPTPGKRLYSPDDHCFCPMCSWLIDAPNLKTKKLGPADKKRARDMSIDAVQTLAVQLGVTIVDSEIDQLLADETTQENAYLVAYGFDLFDRLKGIANGPPVLALWRGFAWNRSGSPKPEFRLSARLIIDAEAHIVRLLQQHRP